ncbi:MAG TPA: DUF2141 domain-containing protein [Blastocatellia bacterium]|nr:DUF2141 domain-containing protein [Blastocatellia bacterium]
MKRFRLTALALFLLPLIATAACSAGGGVESSNAAGAADLTVTVKDVRNSTGTVYLVVYDEAGFGKPELGKAKQKANAAKGDMTFVIHNLPAGKYAASSYHDENNNGKLDRNSLGVPTEGYGFSNDAQGNGGPPKFAQAAFDFDGKTNKQIAFSLNY